MKALITGVTGQDGHYLAEHLNSLGYTVYGGYRRSSSGALPADVEPVSLELTEYESVKRAIQKTQPDEIYNLGAQTHVGESFGCPLYTADVNYRGVGRLLECVRDSKIKVYQASTSEMFGGGVRLNEHSPFNPHSPYAVAKVAAHQQCAIYRKAYGTRVSCGILFNHESPLRGRDFVTRKVCYHAARGLPVQLGNLEARRDWGHAKDYVKAMHMMLQGEPDDYVVATGVSHSVRDLVDLVSKLSGHFVVDTAETEKRPWDVEVLEGDPAKVARLGWKPEYTFETLIEEMMQHETDAARIHTAA